MNHPTGARREAKRMPGGGGIGGGTTRGARLPDGHRHRDPIRGDVFHKHGFFHDANARRLPAG